jgi:hypothetical protein
MKGILSGAALLVLSAPAMFAQQQNQASRNICNKKHNGRRQ